ncbi:Dom-3 Z [Apophysomyces sp. BC1034]|nr:Dom-3 Z [Apophysomyces sp. BC1021]KAG0186949.1 Dom-3 Z [Apophysomyces sp. BC1034]
MSRRKLSSDNSQPVQSKRFARNPQTSKFPVAQADAYQGPLPSYSQPREINSYSIDSDRRVWFDDRELKYYYEPTGKHLSVGYDRFIKRDETLKEHLDTLLDAMTDAQQRSEDPNLTKADIGTIFLEEQATDQKRNWENNKSERQDLMAYWGYKFESLCTASTPKPEDTELQQRITDSANTNVQYCIVVKTKLGKTSLIMGAEVDCIEGTKPPRNGNPLKHYIELKTSRTMLTNRHQYSFERYKLLKFWAQSFLVGVLRVICGFRDEDGRIDSLKTFKTLEIPRKVRGKSAMWNPEVCMNFANDVLEWIRSAIEKDDPAVTYSIVWKEPWHELVLSCEGRTNSFLTQRFLDGETSHEIGGPRAQGAE